MPRSDTFVPPIIPSAIEVKRGETFDRCRGFGVTRLDVFGASTIVSVPRGPAATGASRMMVFDAAQT